ncbi:Uncharacterised protein [Vibrio cholerae]|nr:Uncharacterised protein [Vibrio cholerae]
MEQFLLTIHREVAAGMTAFASGSSRATWVPHRL